MSDKITFVRQDGSKMILMRDPEDSSKWFSCLETTGETLSDLIKKDFEAKVDGGPYKKEIK